MTVAEVFVLIGVAALAAVPALVIGALLMRRAGGRPARTQALLAALVAIGVMVVGILISAKAMFISSHDVRALWVVVAASAAIAVGAAWQLGADIGAGAQRVGALARRLGEPGTPIGPVTRGPSELNSLAAELDEVSARLAESRERERTLERSRRELIAWMSHDLRGPLATIRAMGEALDDEVVDDADAVRRYHHQIRLDAERLSVLVDDLFELSRIHSGVSRTHDGRGLLSDVVADALRGARPAAELKGVTIVDRLRPLPAVEVDAHELTRVLQNLLDNAIRHTPVGGQIALESRADDTGMQLSVLDQCGGIPAADIDRVFDLAFRGDVARAKDAGGGGLGLTIARDLAEANHGTIEVANEAAGCRFTLRLSATA